jgi:hypothetical protein
MRKRTIRDSMASMMRQGPIGGAETPHDIAHADKPQVARPIRVIRVVITVFGLYD